VSRTLARIDSIAQHARESCGPRLLPPLHRVGDEVARTATRRQASANQVYALLRHEINAIGRVGHATAATRPRPSRATLDSYSAAPRRGPGWPNRPRRPHARTCPAGGSDSSKSRRQSARATRRYRLPLKRYNTPSTCSMPCKSNTMTTQTSPAFVSAVAPRV